VTALERRSKGARAKHGRLIALCGIGGLLALAIAGPARAMMISVEESIIWQTPSG